MIDFNTGVMSSDTEGFAKSRFGESDGLLAQLMARLYVVDSMEGSLLWRNEARQWLKGNASFGDGVKHLPIIRLAY